MKNFQQNLLILLAVCLCGLCAFQWYGQTFQRKAIEKLDQVVYDKSLAIRDYTNSIATLNHQVADLDAGLTDLRNEARTNAQKIAVQERELDEMEVTNEVFTNEIAQYKNAVELLTNRLNDAYAGIQKQNAAIKDLAGQRDEFVQKYNDEVKDRNNVVSNYNVLAAEIKKMQEKQ